jgi:integrase
MLKRASLPKIRLHDSRHTALSLMENAGDPISITSEWADTMTRPFTMKTDIHASNDDLRRARLASTC